MSSEAEPARTEWLTLPDVAEMIGDTVGRVRRLLDDDYLVAVRRDGVLRVPALFLDEDRPLSSLRGTIIALRDVGLSTEEIVDWLLSVDDTLGGVPIDALRAGRKTEVRRIARTLV